MRLGLGLGLNRIALGGVTLTIDALTFTAGDPATLEIDVTYTGSEALTAYAVTGTDPVTVTADQLVSGSGGTNTLEFFNFGVTPPNDTDDITGLTSSSNAADRIFLVLQDANGVRSAVEEVTVSGLDFGTPMENDASALFWYNADSVTESGGVITTWADATGNGYDLDAVPTGLSAPAWDGSKATFDGSTTCIRSTNTGPMIPEIYTNSGEVAFFAVVKATAGVTFTGVLFLENLDSGSNRTLGFTVNGNASADSDVRAGARRFSPAMDAIGVYDTDAAVFLMEAVITQTAVTLKVNGTTLDTDAVDLANFPQTPQKISIGARANDAGSSLFHYNGDVYEVFSTADASTGNTDAIRASLASIHGISL